MMQLMCCWFPVLILAAIHANSLVQSAELNRCAPAGAVIWSKQPAARDQPRPTNVGSFDRSKLEFNTQHLSKLNESHGNMERPSRASATKLGSKFGQLSDRSQPKTSSHELEAVGRRTRAQLRSSTVTQSLDPNEEMYHDYRYAFSETRNQGSCGACTIFSTLAMFEWMYYKETGAKTAFSEQYLLDCGNVGCGGGFLNQVIDFVGYHGLEDGQLYPYFGRKKRCLLPMKPSFRTGRWRVSNLTYRHISRKDFGRALDTGPVLIVMSVDLEEFHGYAGGVDQALTCDRLSGPNKNESTKQPDYHAVLLVGDGHQDGQDYWLIRNSYGSQWGENGYYKLSKNATYRCISGDPENSLVVDSGYSFALNAKYLSRVVDKMSPIWHKRLATNSQAAADHLLLDDQEDDYVALETINEFLDDPDWNENSID